MTRQLTLLAGIAIATLFATTTNSQAAEPTTGGQIPASLLAQLGLGDTQQVTDAEGETIRGKGGINHAKKTVHKKNSNKHKATVKNMKPGQHHPKHKGGSKGGSKSTSGSRPSFGR